jgi:hypothetical protein
MRLSILLERRINVKMTEVPEFDAVIPYHEKDAAILPYCILGLRKNTRGLRTIYVVSKEEPEDLEDATWVPESAFPFTLDDVKSIILSTNGRHGWYYQQLLKFYAPFVIQGLRPTFLIPDSDVVFLRPIEFFREGKVLVDYGGMYVPEYFDHMHRLLPTEFEFTIKESGTTDVMMYQTDLLQDLFRRVEAKHGCPMWKALLLCVDPTRYNKSGMSEQDIYFHFVLNVHPGRYELRLLQKFYGVHLLEVHRTDADFLSFHAWFKDYYEKTVLEGDTSIAVKK